MRRSVINKVPVVKLLAGGAAVFLLTILGFIASCTIVPQEKMFVTANSSLEISRDNGNCEQRTELPGENSGLSPDNISILNWNIYKGNRDNWQDVFAQLMKDKDIVLLQEALLTDELLDILETSRLSWNFNGAFTFKGNESGVLSASKVNPVESCGFRILEPILRLPKAAMVSRYPIKNSAQTLLVGNIHGINFTLGQATYENQMTTMREVIANHDGPAILAGDFNNWSEKRMETVKRVAEELGLTGIEFAYEDRTRIFGRSVDHVFYRGVEPVELKSHPTESSDHYPLTVTFRLDEQPIDALTQN